MNGNSTLRLTKFLSLALVIICITLLVLEIVYGYTGFDVLLPKSTSSSRACNNTVGTNYNNKKFNSENFPPLLICAFLGTCVALAAALLATLIAFAASTKASNKEQKYAKSHEFVDEGAWDEKQSKFSQIDENTFNLLFFLLSVAIWLVLLVSMRYSDIVISSYYSVCPIRIDDNVIYALAGVAGLGVFITGIALSILYWYHHQMLKQAQLRYLVDSGLRSTEYLYDTDNTGYDNKYNTGQHKKYNTGHQNKYNAGYHKALLAKDNTADIHSGRELLEQQQPHPHLSSYNSGNEQDPKIAPLLNYKRSSHLQEIRESSKLMAKQGSFSEYNSKLKDVSLGAGLHANSEVKTLKEQLDGSWRDRIEKMNSGLTQSITPTERYATPVEKKFLLQRYQQQQLNGMYSEENLDVKETNIEVDNQFSQKPAFDMSSLVPNPNARVVNKQDEVQQGQNRHRGEAPEDKKRKERKMRHSRQRKEKQNQSNGLHQFHSESNKTVRNAEDPSIERKRRHHHHRSSSREDAPARQRSRSHRDRAEKIQVRDSEEVISLKYSDSLHSRNKSHRSRSKHTEKKSKLQNIENKSEQKSQKSSHHSNKMIIHLHHPKFKSQIDEQKSDRYMGKSGHTSGDNAGLNVNRLFERKDKSDRKRERSHRSSQSKRRNHHINEVTVQEYSVRHIPKIKKTEPVLLTNLKPPGLDQLPRPKREKIRRHHRHRIEDIQTHPRSSSRHHSKEKHRRHRSKDTLKQREDRSEVISRKSETVEKPNGQTLHITTEKREIHVVKGPNQGSLLNQNPLSVERGNQQPEHKIRTRRHRSRDHVKRDQEKYERKMNRL